MKISTVSFFKWTPAFPSVRAPTTLPACLLSHMCLSYHWAYKNASSLWFMYEGPLWNGGFPSERLGLVNVLDRTCVLCWAFRFRASLPPHESWLRAGKLLKWTVLKNPITVFHGNFYECPTPSCHSYWLSSVWHKCPWACLGNMILACCLLHSVGINVAQGGQSPGFFFSFCTPSGKMKKFFWGGLCWSLYVLLHMGSQDSGDAVICTAASVGLALECGKLGQVVCINCNNIANRD